MSKLLLRKGDDVPFTQVPNEILCEKSLSFRDKGLYAYLMSKPDGWDFASLRIANETKESRDAIRSSLTALEEAGYIKRVRQSNGRMEYALYCYPQKPETENTAEGEPETEKATDGKSHRRNIRPISNKEEIQETKINTIAPNDGAGKSSKKPKRPLDEPMDLDQFVTYMRQSPNRAVNLIGEWADTIKPNFTTWGQWNTFMRRHLRAAQQIAPFTDDQIADAYDKVTTLQAKSDFKPTIETLIKFLT